MPVDDFVRHLERRRMEIERDALPSTLLARQMINERTDRGIDRFGKKFAPYSTEYAKDRRRAGKSTSPVQLRYTGQMRDSLTIRKQGPDDRYVIAPNTSRDQRLLRVHRHGTRDGTIPARDFWGLTPQQMARWVDGRRKIFARVDPTDKRSRDLIVISL